MHPSETPLTHACMDDVCTRIDDRLKWMEVRFLKTFVSQHILPSPLLFSPYWYLGSDGCGCDVGGGAVLGGRHTAVLLLLILLLALHALVLRLATWRTVGRRREGRRR